MYKGKRGKRGIGRKRLFRQEERENEGKIIRKNIRKRIYRREKKIRKMIKEAYITKRKRREK